MTGEHILVVDDEPDIRQLIQEILQDEGYDVSTAADAQEARNARQTRRPDLTLLDIWMPGVDGISLLKEWGSSAGLDTPVIMMSGHGTVETAVEATRLGAYDFIEKPLSMAKLLLAVRHGLQASRLKSENQGLKKHVLPANEPIGKSDIMVAIREQITRIAPHDTSVLLTGEPGSGKSTCARYLHELSPRSESPFVAINVAGMSADNDATELLGSEDNGKIHYGWLEKANGGTLYLNDIADMPLSAQNRLVTAIQHQSFLRINGQEEVNINVRVLAGTSHSLAKEVSDGKFREDLFYQLNVVPIQVPPLRDHLEDVSELLEFFVNNMVSSENLPYRHFNLAAQNHLRNHPWHGNLNELRNLVQRLLILGGDDEISKEEVEIALGKSINDGAVEISATGFDLPLREARDQFEKLYLEYHLQQTDGNVSQVSQRTGIERTHLYRKLRALGLGPKKR